MPVIRGEFSISPTTSVVTLRLPTTVVMLNKMDKASNRQLTTVVVAYRNERD